MSAERSFLQIVRVNCMRVESHFFGAFAAGVDFDALKAVVKKLVKSDTETSSLDSDPE